MLLPHLPLSLDEQRVYPAAAATFSAIRSQLLCPFHIGLMEAELQDPSKPQHWIETDEAFRLVY